MTPRFFTTRAPRYAPFLLALVLCGPWPAATAADLANRAGLANLTSLANPAGPRRSTGPASPNPSSPSSKTVLRRFALITGASQGGHDRVPLRFAASDARAMRHVLTDLGGLTDTETLLLLDVGRTGLRDGFQRVKAMIAGAAAPASDVRTEMIFYYSGHSDETGLLLGQERVSYAEIRAWVDETAADVRIAVLDSCASGAMTRGKGGVHRPPFLVDTSSAARGHAYLTASAENEAAQESDRLGAAYFTHYLVSGLRGAADVSRDGRVTLGEAYQYAFTETLARTEASRGGPQHASYDFQLAGKGDLVMTDLRATSASLVLPPEMNGRLFVRDAEGQLIAEVHKLPAQPIELGLPPGRYRVTLDDQHRLFESTIDLGAGNQTTLTSGMLIAMVPATGTTKGGAAFDDSLNLGLSRSVASPPLAPPPRHVLNLSLFPPIDSNGGVPSDNVVVVGLVARSTRLNGVAVTFAHYVDGDTRGLELAAIGSWSLGDATGMHIAGALDYVGGSLRGTQVAGAVAAIGGGRGWQIAGLGSYSRGDFQGLQLAGGVNLARGELRGFQLAGGVNLAQRLTGGQLSVVNIAGEVSGAQIGVVNIGRRVRGTQLGLVNVAEHVDGASVGLVTFVKDGTHAVEVSSSEVGATVIGVLLGTRHVYTRLGLGILAGANDLPGGRTVAAGTPAERSHFLFQWGLGGHLVLTDRWFVEGELVGSQYYRTQEWHQEDAVTGSARLLLGARLAGPLTVVFGPTYNTSVGWNGTDLVTGSGFAETVSRSGHTVVRQYPGFLLGIRL